MYTKALFSASICLAATAALAQIGGISTGEISRQKPANNQDPVPQFNFPSKLSVGYQPFVRFRQGSFLDTNASLFWADYTLQPYKNAGGATSAISAWFAFKGSSNAWAINYRHPFTKNVSAMVSMLGGNSPSSKSRRDYALYGIYSRILVDTPVAARRSRGSETASTIWLGNNQLLASLGAGVYSYAATSGGYRPTGFVQLQYLFYTGFTIDASAWVVSKPSNDKGIERFALGIGFKF